METKITGATLASILDVKADVVGRGVVIRGGKVVYDTPPEAVEASETTKEDGCEPQPDCS